MVISSQDLRANGSHFYVNIFWLWAHVMIGGQATVPFKNDSCCPCGRRNSPLSSVNTRRPGRSLGQQHDHTGHLQRLLCEYHKEFTLSLDYSLVLLDDKRSVVLLLKKNQANRKLLFSQTLLSSCNAFLYSLQCLKGTKQSTIKLLVTSLSHS